MIIFDLDGTLIDSKIDIANAVNHTLRQLNQKEIENEVIYGYVGYGIEPLLKNAFSKAQKDISYEEALDIFNTFYKGHCLDNTTLFPDVIHILDYYSDKKKVLLSNKTYYFIDIIVNGLSIKNRFDYIFGGDSLPFRKPDPMIIKNIIACIKAPTIIKAIIIGDSKIDIEAGKNAEILTCGVTYGFRPKEEIISASPDYIIDSLRELKRYIC